MVERGRLLLLVVATVMVRPFNKRECWTSNFQRRLHRQTAETGSWIVRRWAVEMKQFWS